jgi:RHS repeat-associated protein
MVPGHDSADTAVTGHLYMGTPIERSSSTGRDADGRICAVQATPVSGYTAMTGYIYDAEGTRVAKGTITNWSAGCNTATNGFIMTTSYILGPGNEQLTELAWSGGVPKPAHTNVFAAGQLAATYSNSDPDDEPAGILYFQLTDWLGTRRVGTDSAGNTAEVCHSLPFGDGEDCSPLAPTEHIFTGKERDAESGGDGGNDYFGARYYASSMGRFLSADWSAQAEPVPYAKMDNPQTLNLYAFVGNNPLRDVDADGHIAGDFAYDEFEMMEFQIKKEADAERTSHNQPVQQQNGSSKRTGFFGGLGQRFKNLFTGHGFKTNMELTPVVTHHIFFSASAEAGPFSQSVSYVPSTNNLYYNPGAGTGSGISLTAGWATDPNGFAGGPSGSVCVFYGVGGCGGISTSGDYAGQAGIGIGGWGAAAGYGIDPVQTMIKGMVEGEPVDPLAINVGGIYMEDPQTWIPQN